MNQNPVPRLELTRFSNSYQPEGTVRRVFAPGTPAMPFCQRGSTFGEITMTGLAMHQGAFERQFNPQAPSDLDGLAGQLGRPVTGIEPAPAPIAGEDHPAIVDPAKVVEALRETVDRLGEQVRALEARVETLAANSKEAKDA